MIMCDNYQQQAATGSSTHIVNDGFNQASPLGASSVQINYGLRLVGKI
jgi:hypothetical protein